MIYTNRICPPNHHPYDEANHDNQELKNENSKKKNEFNELNMHTINHLNF